MPAQVGPAQPPAPPAVAAPGPSRDGRLRRFAGNLRSVARFARPYWWGLALSFALMSLESITSAGRIFLFYPVFTRVMQVGGTDATPGSQGGDAAAAVNTLRQRVKGFAGAYDAFLDGLNGWTGKLVPEAWIAGSTQDDPARAAEKRRDLLERYATLLSVSLLFVLFIVVMCASAYVESYVTAWVSLSIAMDVRTEVTRKLLDQPVQFYDRQKRGELVGRALGDVDGYYQWLTQLLQSVLKGAIQLAGSIVILVGVSVQLSLICLLGLPFLLPMRNLMRKTLKRSHRKMQESAKRVESLLQIFGGIRTVKAFGTEAQRLADFHRMDREVTRVSLKVQSAKSSADALIEFINNFLALVLAVGGGWLVLRRVLDVQPAELVIFLFLVANLYQPLKKLVKAYNQMQESGASVERTQEYLGLPPPPADPADAVAFPGVKGSIRFEQVGFAYVEGRPVLQDVSFEIPRGGVVALVGPSGGGKSTLCDLLLRFYDPASGRITVDGVDLRHFKRASWLAQVAVVNQSPFLFHTSIGENIRQGRLDATQAQVEQAARDAQIHEHVAALPSGYAEEVGEAGVRLSGGQRQRITIARALVRDPNVLVLDEATASLDTASEKAVQQALERLQEGRTTLVVAHRLSTVQNATRIVVLDHGRVVDQGTHAELLARAGLYAELVRMQDLSPVALPGPAASAGPEPAALPAGA